MTQNQIKLYSLERQESFRLMPAGIDVHDIARKFVAGPLGPPDMIEKCNQRSAVYTMLAGSKRLIVKSVQESLAEKLEVQCAVANSIPHRLIKPLVSNDGSFVYSDGRNAWMAYWAIEGEIFDGANLPVQSVIFTGLDFLFELRQLARPVGLQTFQHRPEKWAECMSNITDPASAHRSLSGSGYYLSAPTLSTLSQRRGKLIEMTNRLSGLARKTEEALVHNDLQHANIVIASGGPVFLDLEDIGFDVPQVAVAHAVFKLFRHAVFSGKMSPAEVRKSFPSFVQKLETHPAWAGALATLSDYMYIRAISDISEILLLWHEARDASDLYDLEKRIHNMLEISDLFGDATSWT